VFFCDKFVIFSKTVIGTEKMKETT